VGLYDDEGIHLEIEWRHTAYTETVLLPTVILIYQKPAYSPMAASTSPETAS